MSDRRVVFSPISSSLEEPRSVRARAWIFVFECFDRHTKKKAASASGPDAGKEIDERSGKRILPK